MTLDKKKQNDPNESTIKFILELFNLKKLVEAKKEVNAQIIKYPNSPILFNILGAIFADQNLFDEAVKNYNNSIKINPSYAQAHNNLGIALQKLKKLNQAIDSYKKAIALNSIFPEAYNNLGNAKREIGNSKDAVQYFKKALEIKFDFPDAHHNLGSAYEETGNVNDALKSFEKAIEIKPNYFQAYNSLGLLLTSLLKFDEATKVYNEAIKINPNYEKPYNNLGNLQNDLGLFDLAKNSYLKAIKAKPYYPKAQSNLLFSLNYETNFDIKNYLSEAKQLGLSWKLNKKNLLIKYKYEKNPKKLKLGLVSSDFGNHPGGYFTLSTLKELKKMNFELIAYSNLFRRDEYVHNFKSLFSKWHSIEKKDDEEVVKQIIEDGIHILVDMQGHSAHNRLTLFVYKSAPVQISWLAQGSTGISEIDYFVGSKYITPKEEEGYFVEKIFALPEISQVFTPPDFNVEIKDLPAKKNNFITFGCLNKLTKVNDEVINLWSKILYLIPNSKILIKSWELSNHNFRDKTLERFKKFNIDEKRIIFQGKSKTRKELLETYNKIDISLDPFPFQGNTSTCESIWMVKSNRYLSI